MAGPRGLGRGLDALIRQNSIPTKDEPAAAEIVREARTVPIDRIRANPWQPRTAFSDESLSELAASIRTQGVLQPILARPVSADGSWDFELVAGERRLRAAKMAGLREIPAVVRELDDEQSLAIALIENLQRENLNPVDEAKGLARLRDMLGLSQEELAARVGKSRSNVANALRLLQLPDDVLERVASGDVSQGHARAILAVTDESARRELRDLILGSGLSVREAEALASYHKEHGEFPRPAEITSGDATEAATLLSDASRAPRSPKPVDERLAGFEDRLRELLHASVDIKGVLERGRIVIKYKGKDDLSRILELIEGDRP